MDGRWTPSSRSPFPRGLVLRASTAVTVTKDGEEHGHHELLWRQLEDDDKYEDGRQEHGDACRTPGFHGAGRLVEGLAENQRGGLESY